MVDHLEKQLARTGGVGGGGGGVISKAHPASFSKVERQRSRNATQIPDSVS